MVDCKRSRISLARGKADEMVIQSPFQLLPLNIVCKIFCNLHASAKETARLVCSEWKKIIEAHFVQFHALLNDENYNDVVNSRIRFDTVTVSSFNLKLQPGTVETTSLSRSKLAFGCSSLEFSTAISGIRTSPENMATLLRLNRGVQTLRFRLHSLKGIRSLDLHGLHMLQLTRLEIAITKEIMSDITVFGQLSEIRFPRLSELIIHIPKFIVFEHYKTGRFYVVMFQFIAKFKSTLAVLDVRSDYYLFFPLMALPSIYLPVNHHELRILRENLAGIQLEELTYLFKRPECHPPYNIGLHLLKCQQRLVRLKIEERNEHQILLPIMFQVLQQNRNTLTDLSWRISSRLAELSLSYMPLGPELLQGLADCKNLNSLHLYGFQIDSIARLNCCRHIKSIHLEGDLSPGILEEVATMFPDLESLKFYHHTPLERGVYGSLTANLRSVMRLPKLRIIHWYVCGLFLHYVPRRPDITIARGKQGRHYYVIRFKRN